MTVIEYSFPREGVNTIALPMSGSLRVQVGTIALMMRLLSLIVCLNQLIVLKTTKLNEAMRSLRKLRVMEVMINV